MLLVGSIGWGLLAVGALTHIWHHRRLRELLAQHFDNEAPVAIGLTGAETFLALALPVGALTDARWLPIAALGAVLLAAGFVLWIARLLATGSDLPCACSFSSGPTSRWSLLRAAAVLTSGLIAFAPLDVAIADRVATMVVGAAVGAALHVVPEALAWPEVSRAQLARIDSHAPNATARSNQMGDRV